MDELGENCTEKEKNNKLYFYYENKLNLYNDNLFENIINNTNEDFDFNDKNSRKVMTNISLSQSSNDLFNLRLLEGEKNDTVYKMNNNNSNSSNNNIYSKENTDGDQTSLQNNADNLSKNNNSNNSNNNSSNNNEYMFSYLNVYLNKKIKNKPGENNTSNINPSNNNSNTVAESNNIMNDKNTSKIMHTNINGVSNFGNTNPEENNTVNKSNTLVSGIYKVNSYPKEKTNNNNTNNNNNNVNTFLNAHTVPSTCDSSANFSNNKIYPFDDIEKNHEITENDINNNEQTTNCLNNDTYFTNEINLNKMENIKSSDNNLCNFINCSNDTKKNVIINPDFQGKINSITSDRKNGDKILFQDENKIYKNFRFPQSTNVDGKNVTKQNQNINSQDSENNVSTLKKNNINDNPTKFVNNEHTSDNNFTNNTDKKIQNNNNNSSYSANPGNKTPSLTQKDKLQRIEDKENYKSFLNVINKRMENFARAKNMTNSENAFKKSDCSEKDENISTRHEEIDKEKIENPKKHTINEINNYTLNESKKTSRNSSIENDNGKNINIDDTKMVYDQHKLNNNQSENSSMKSLERYTQMYSYSEGVETNISTNNNSTSNMEALNNTYIFSPPTSSSYNNSQFKRMNDSNRSNNNTCNNIMSNINYKDNMFSNNLNMIEEGIKREQPLGNKNQLNMAHPNSIPNNYTTCGDTNMGNENNSNMRNENGSNIHINNIGQKNNSNKKIIYKDEFNINKGNLIDNINHGPIFNSPDNYTSGENCYNNSKEYFMNENINNAMFNGDYLMTHSGKKDPLDIEDGIRDENNFVSSDDFFNNPHGGETRLKDSQPFGNKIYPIMSNTGRYNNTPTSKENIIGVHNNDNLFCLNSNKQCNQIKTYNNNNSATMETTDSYNNILSVGSKYNFLNVVSKRQNNNNDTNINSTLGTLNDCVKDGKGNRSNSGNCSFGDRYYSQQNYDNNKSALKNVKHCDKSVLKSVDKNMQHKNSHHKSFHKKFHDDLSHSDHYNLVNSISSPNIFSNVVSTNYFGTQIGDLKKEKVSDTPNEYNKISNNLISTPEEMPIYTQSDRIINEFAIDNNSNIDKNSNSNEQTVKKKTKKKYMFNPHGGENNCSIRGNSNKCNKSVASNSIDGASLKSADSGRSICSKLEGGTATMSSRNDYNNIMDDKLNGHMVGTFTTHNNMLSNMSEDQGGGCSTTCNSDIGNSIHIFNNSNTIDKNSNSNKNHYITNMYYEQNFKSEGDSTYPKCNKDRNPIFCNTRENNNLIKKNIKSNVKAYFLLDKKEENINVTQNNRSNIMHIENNDTSRTTIKKETPFNEFASSNTHKYNDIHNKNSEFISSDNRHRINNNVKQVNLPIDDNSTTPDFSNISHINNPDCGQDGLQYSSTMFIPSNNTSNNNANENNNHCINPNRIGVNTVDEANYSSWKKVGGIGNVKGMEMNKYPYKNPILIDNSNNNNNKNNNQINYMSILHDPVKYSPNNKQDVFINKYMDIKIKNMDDNMNIDYTNERFIINNNANLKNTPCNNNVSNLVMNPNYLLQGNGNMMFKNMPLGAHEYNMEMTGKPDFPVSVSPMNTNISNTIKENKNVISNKNPGAVKNVGANKPVHNFNFNLIEGNTIDNNNSKVNNLMTYKRNNGANNLLENNEKLNIKINCPNEESNNSESHINNKNKIYTEANLKGIGINSNSNINRNTVANYKVNNILINDKLKNILLSKNFNNFLIGDENKIGIRNTINNTTHNGVENEACTSSSTLGGLKNSNVLPGNNIPKLKEPYNYYPHLKNHIPPNNNVVNKKINEIPENNKLQDMNGIYSNYIEQGSAVMNTKENASINTSKEYNNKHVADISKSIGSPANANYSLNYIESVYNIYPSSLLNAKNKIRRNGKPGGNNFNENVVNIPSQQRQISQIENENKYYNNINTQEGNNKKIVNLNFQDMLIYKQNNLNIDEINKEKYDPIFNNYVNSGGIPSMNNKNIPRQCTNSKISNTPINDINNNRNIVSKSTNSYQTPEDPNKPRIKEDDLFSSLNMPSKPSCNDPHICHQGNFQDKRTIVCGDNRMAKEKKITLLGTRNKNSVQVTCVSGVIGSIENNNVPPIYSNLANSNLANSNLANSNLANSSSYFQNRGPETATKNTISYKPPQNNNNDMNSQAIMGLKNENKLINNGKGLISSSNHNKRIDQTDDKKIENICNNKNEGITIHDINKNKIYDIFLCNKKNYISNNNNNLYTNLNNNNNNNMRSTIQNAEYFYSKMIQNNNLARYNEELIKTIDRNDDVNPVDPNVISPPPASVSNTSPNLVKKEIETYNNNCISEKDLSYYKNVNYKNMDIDNYVLYHQQEKDITEKYLKNRNYISSDNNIKIESIQKQPNDHNSHILRNINMNANIANNNLIINKGVIKNIGNIPDKSVNYYNENRYYYMNELQQHSIIANKYGPNNNENNSNLGGGTVLNTIGSNNKKEDYDENVFRISKSQFISLEKDIKYLQSLTLHNINSKDLYFEAYEEKEIFPYDHNGIETNPNYYFNNGENNNDYIFINDHGMNDSKLFNNTSVNDISNNGPGGCIKKEMKKTKVYTNKLNTSLKYSVIEEGSFGVVYKGWYKNMHVAVKVPVEKMVKQDPYGLTKRSINEWKILSKCEHPNIIKLYGGIIHSYFDIWLVTKLINGSDLHTIKNNMNKEERVLSTDISLKMCRQLAAVINFLHTPIKNKKNVIIHRDIKPENLIIDSDWNIHLCDFGDSEETEDGNVSNVSGATWIYAPPELLTCHPLKQSSDYNFLDYAQLSYKWDIWSMGCVFQEMMNLPSPFQHYIISFDESDQIYEKLVDVFTKKLPPCIHSKIDNSPFADIIKLCLNYDPNLRPTAKEIVDLLNQPNEYLLLKRR